MRALGFEPKKEEIKKMISDIDKVSANAIPLFSECFSYVALGYGDFLWLTSAYCACANVFCIFSRMVLEPLISMNFWR
jgi:hypothetical protein